MKKGHQTQSLGYALPIILGYCILFTKIRQAIFLYYTVT
jgi:hypothetical protein